MCADVLVVLRKDSPAMRQRFMSFYRGIRIVNALKLYMRDEIKMSQSTSCAPSHAAYGTIVQTISRFPDVCGYRAVSTGYPQDWSRRLHIGPRKVSVYLRVEALAALGFPTGTIV
jgi:hypothetical protein